MKKVSKNNLAQKNLDPWQEDVAEIIYYAIQHIKEEEDFYRKVGFLLIDLGIETLFKTYLTLPNNITNAKITFREMKKAVNGNFHELISAVAISSAEIDEEIINKIKYYHSLRNKLYHDGYGINIPYDKVLDYSLLAMQLLKILLDVNLHESLIFNPEDVEIKSKEIKNKKKTIDEILFETTNNVKLVIEKIEPNLLLPSTLKMFNEVSNNKDMYLLHKKIDIYIEKVNESFENSEIKEWSLNLFEHDITSGNEIGIANTIYIFDILKDPMIFYFMIIGAFVLEVDDFSGDTFYSGNVLEGTDDPDLQIIESYSSLISYSDWFVSLINQSNKLDKRMADALLVSSKKYIENIKIFNSKLIKWLEMCLTSEEAGQI